MYNFTTELFLIEQYIYIYTLTDAISLIMYRRLQPQICSWVYISLRGGPVIHNMLFWDSHT